ncbi:hypothetical protein JOQ06_022597, partial [Pogonophryne albipinna]
QDGTTLTLTSTQKTVQGVKLSKDVDGVTAEMPIGNNVTTIVFDGTTAQILLTGTSPSRGLCLEADSTLKVSEFSPSSCETLVSEPADSHINCTIMTDRCNILKKGPFTSCHNQKISYKNVIKIDDNVPSSRISRSDLINMNFSCYFNQPTRKSLSFNLKGG